MFDAYIIPIHAKHGQMQMTKLQNMHTEIYSNIKCAEWWIPAKRCRNSVARYMTTGSVNRIWGSGSQTRGAGSGIPPQFNPWPQASIVLNQLSTEQIIRQSTLDGRSSSTAIRETCSTVLVGTYFSTRHVSVDQYVLFCWHLYCWQHRIRNLTCFYDVINAPIWRHCLICNSFCFYHSLKSKRRWWN